MRWNDRPLNTFSSLVDPLASFSNRRTTFLLPGPTVVSPFVSFTSVPSIDISQPRFMSVFLAADHRLLTSPLRLSPLDGAELMNSW